METTKSIPFPYIMIQDTCQVKVWLVFFHFISCRVTVSQLKHNGSRKSLMYSLSSFSQETTIAIIKLTETIIKNLLIKKFIVNNNLPLKHASAS